MKRLLTIWATGMLVAACIAPAEGALSLRLSDDGVNWMEIADDGGSDIVAGPGGVAYIGTVGGWTVNVAVGLSKPLAGSAAKPYMEIHASVSSGSALSAPLKIQISDTDFGPILPSGGEYMSLIGGLTDGMVTFTGWADDANTPYGTNTILFDRGPFTGGAFGDSAHNANGPSRAPYSLTLETEITHCRAGRSGFDAVLETVRPTIYDFGDLPDVYGTTLSANGPRHLITLGGPILGNIVDGESDGQPTTAADGDDTTANDDEDGVTFLSPLDPGTNATVRVTGTAGAKLDAWIDFNANSLFEAGEQIAASTILTGSDVINFMVPMNVATMAPIYARFRVSTAGGLGSTGLAPDGETEDYLISASVGDYVWLDVNRNGIQDFTESGLGNIVVEIYHANATGILASTTTASDGSYLFQDLVPGNYYIRSYLPPNAPNTTNSFSPQDVGSDDTRDSDVNPSGITSIFTLNPGQVDMTRDIGIYIKPTLVTLASFDAVLEDGQTIVRWTTASEHNTIGFFLERLDAGSGTYVPVNAAMVPGALFSSGEQAYAVTDPAVTGAGPVTYRLVEIERDGSRNIYGPFPVTLQGATTDGADAIAPAVTINGFQSVNGNVLLRWTSDAGATYRIEHATAVTGPFTAAATGIPATPPENVVVLIDLADAAYYRVIAE